MIIQQSLVYTSVIIFVLLIILLLILLFAYIKGTKENRVLIDLINKRSGFFRNIIHEIRTPLTVIIGLNNELKTKALLNSKECRSFMEAIDRQGMNLIKLVNQLLNMSKINARMDNIPWENSNIISYLEMVIDSLRIYAKKKDQSIYFMCNESHIFMDFIPQYIENVVQNLLSNAIKFSPPKSVIQVSVKKNKGIFVLEVADQGIGISRENQKKIFDLFYQVSISISENGSGIGLNYTKQMIENMKGRIEVESEEHHGSVFRILMPIKHISKTKIPSGNKKSSENVVSLTKAFFLQIKQPHQEAEMSDSAKILLIEDNRDVVFYLRALLSDNYHVVAVDNGVEGLNLANSIIPDIIISDIIMPYKDGFMLCKDIRTSELLNHIPIILLTAKSSVDDRIKGFQYGADAYIVKPFKSNELVAQIEALLENRKLLKEKYMRSILKGDKILFNDINMNFLQRATDIVYSEMHNSQFSVVSFAEKLSISTSQLNRKLTAISGYSPSNFIIRLRIEHAKKKLEKDDKPIGVIAEECGYYDLAYFSRIFKKMTDKTPSQYRRLHR